MDESPLLIKTMPKQLAFILVGDHLGQVKKVLLPNGEISLLADCATPSSANPVVSIEPIGQDNKQLIANRNGELYIYDCVQDIIRPCQKADDLLNKALPATGNKVVLIYDKHVAFEGQGDCFAKVKQKKSEIKNAKLNDKNLALVGIDIPLRIFDVEKKSKIFEAEPPEKDWLGIKPDVYVSGVDFTGGGSRVATCSKSDSVIRVYDAKSKPKPVILVDINQTAFNEHADAAKFISVASTGTDGHSIVVGSNVGQILAIDLRFNVKHIPRKKLQPKTYKILGGFKGARGGSIKDVKVVPSDNDDDSTGHKVISCCLDRYLRIHNFTKNGRYLDKHVYMNTKPYCCSPVIYEAP